MDPILYRPKIEVDLSGPRNLPPKRTYCCVYPKCGFKSGKYTDINKHVCEEHECSLCCQGFEKLSSHQCQTGRGLYSTRFRLIKETHNKQVQVYEISYAGEDITSVEKAFEVANLELYNIISTSQTGMNVSISLDTVMERVKDLSTFDRTFFGAYITFQSSMFISTKLRAAMDYLNAGLALYENVESGAGLKYVKKMIVKAFPLTHGKMAGTYIKLPKELRRKHVVSIKAG